MTWNDSDVTSVTGSLLIEANAVIFLLDLKHGIQLHKSIGKNQPLFKYIFLSFYNVPTSLEIHLTQPRL